MKTIGKNVPALLIENQWPVLCRMASRRTVATRAALVLPCPALRCPPSPLAADPGGDGPPAPSLPLCATPYGRLEALQ